MKIIPPLILLIACLRLLSLYEKDITLSRYDSVLINLFFMSYPIIYFLLIAKGKVVYNPFYFMMSSVFLSYFLLEIILTIMLDVLFKTGLVLETPMLPFKIFITQLLYGSLIYFGWKLGKIQKV